MLWWFGGPLEALLGRGRFITVYLLSLLAGSAGALLFAPGHLHGRRVGRASSGSSAPGSSSSAAGSRSSAARRSASSLLNLVLSLRDRERLARRPPRRPRRRDRWRSSPSCIRPRGHAGYSRIDARHGRSGSSAIAIGSLVLIGARCRQATRRRSPHGRLAADRDGRDARLGEGGLRRREAGERDAVGRAAHVVEPELVAERDRARVAAVLAADAELDRPASRRARARSRSASGPHPARVERRRTGSPRGCPRRGSA